MAHHILHGQIVNPKGGEDDDAHESDGEEDEEIISLDEGFV